MWTFGQRMGLGFALSFTVLFLVALLALQGTRSMSRSSELLSRSHETLGAVTGILSALKDAETGQRGFLLTGEESYLEPFNDGSQAVMRWFAALERTPVGQQEPARLTTIREAIGGLLDLQRERIAMRRQASLAEVLAKVKGGEGKRRMDGLRRALGEIERQSQVELGQHAEAMAAATQRMTLVVLLGSLSGLAVVIGAWVVLQRSLNRTVKHAATEVQSQADALQATSHQHASAAGETATSMSEVSVTMQELLATSRQIAMRAGEVAEAAATNGRMAEQGRQTVDAHRATVANMQQRVDQVVQAMVGLGKKAQGIGGIVSTAEDLAEQTNILAINATIEASTAGVVGQRFEVVAEEIRRMADRMREAAREIRLQLDDVQGSANTTVMATEAGAKAVDASAVGFDDVTRVLATIGERVARSHAAADEIQVATQQQSSAIEQLEAAFSAITQSSREARESSARNLQTAVVLAGAAGRLSQFVTPTKSWTAAVA